jgi:16S rRNA (adenine1518-N6/adenine1519-N6)-dimethyltransferase
VPVEDLTSRKEVASLLRAAGVRPSKRLGQNFLVDRAVLDAIIAEVKRAAPREILEIGAGLGTVTRELARIAPRVVAVEVDRRLVQILERVVGDLKSVEIKRQDFLSFNFATAFDDRRAFVVGNIPYRITSPILKRLVEKWESLSHALLLTQSEVAKKIAASPGPDGTALGVLVRAYADLSIICPVAKECFYPVPEVDSILWRLSFLAHPRFSASQEVFFTVVRALYGKRRKMIRSALRDLLPIERIAEVLSTAGIDPTARGEKLTFAQLDRLAFTITPFQPQP